MQCIITINSTYSWKQLRKRCLFYAFIFHSGSNNTEFLPLFSNLNDDPPLITEFCKCSCICANCTMLLLCENYFLNNKETAFYKKRYIILICSTVMKCLTKWGKKRHSLSNCFPVSKTAIVILSDYCNILSLLLIYRSCL